jgi:phage virion morphogenesis protein
MADSQGASVSFDLKEVSAVKKLLAKASLDNTDRSRLLQSIGVEMEAQTQERFDTKKSPDGDSWKSIAEKTRQYYKRSPFLAPKPPLVLEGMLRGSLTSEVRDGAWSVLTGATMEYAAVHQFGWLKKNIPARPYLGVSQDDAKAIEAAVTLFLEGIIK